MTPETPENERRIIITETGEQIYPQIGSLLAVGNQQEAREEAQQTPTTDPLSAPVIEQSEVISEEPTLRLEKQIIELLTGEKVEIVLKPRLSGKQFFIYQGKVRQLGQLTADNWLVIERVYTINGQIPTLDLLMGENGLDGDQRSAVDRAIHSNLTPLTSDEETLEDGRVIKRRKLKSVEYLTFKSELGNNPTHAFRNCVLKSFTIDDEPITLLDFEDASRIDFDLASTMVLRLAQIFGMGI